MQKINILIKTACTQFYLIWEALLGVHGMLIGHDCDQFPTPTDKVLISIK